MDTCDSDSGAVWTPKHGSLLFEWRKQYKWISLDVNIALGFQNE